MSKLSEVFFQKISNKKEIEEILLEILFGGCKLKLEIEDKKFTVDNKQHNILINNKEVSLVEAVDVLWEYRKELSNKMLALHKQTGRRGKALIIVLLQGGEEK